MSFTIKKRGCKVIVRVHTKGNVIQKAHIDTFFAAYRKLVTDNQALIILFHAKDLTFSMYTLVFINQLVSLFKELRPVSEKNVKVVAMCLGDKRIASCINAAVQADTSPNKVPFQVHADVKECKVYLRRFS